MGHYNDQETNAIYELTQKGNTDSLKQGRSTIDILPLVKTY